MFEKLKNIDKKMVLGVGAVLAALLGVAFLVEYFGFEYRLNSLPESERGVRVVEKSDIVAENFNLNEKGEYVSLAENASLTVSTGGKYVNNLEWDFPEKNKYDASIKFIDSQSGKEFVLKKNLDKSMGKNDLNFLRFAVFGIQDNPEKIVIQEPTAGTVISNVRIDNAYYFNFFRFIFIFSAGLLMAIFWAWRKKIGAHPEHVFLAIALISGTLIAVAEPRTFVSWDEKIHYKRADEYSFKNIVKKEVKDVYAGENLVPFSNSIKEQKVIDQYLDSNYKKENKFKDFSLSDFSLLEFYNYLAYLPQGIALALGRVIHLPAHVIFLLGRWVNLLVYSGIIFLAIRKLKTGKMIMATIALFPTSIFLASNYGYDSWVIAFTMLGLSWFLSELQQPEKKMTVREMALMIGSLVVGIGAKAIYFPLMLLLFLLPKSKFETSGQYKKFMLASAFSFLFVLGSFLLPFLIAGPGEGDRRGGELVDATGQVKFILSEPVAYVKILVNFMKDYINPLNASGLAIFFAYLGIMNEYWFYLILVVLAVVTFTDKNEYDKKTATLKLRLLIIGIYLATVALIASALYVSFTEVRSETIAGVQPRYLIPLLFPLLFVIGSSRVKNPINRNIYNAVIFGFMAFVLLQGIWDLIIKMHY